MSADNWAECPQCVVMDIARYAGETQKVADAYGKVGPDEYLAMIGALSTFEPRSNENLREDYELGIYKGKFCVTYKGRCDRCGFKHLFEVEEPIKIKGD